MDGAVGNKRYPLSNGCNSVLSAGLVLIHFLSAWRLVRHLFVLLDSACKLPDRYVRKMATVSGHAWFQAHPEVYSLYHPVLIMSTIDVRTQTVVFNISDRTVEAPPTNGQWLDQSPIVGSCTFSATEPHSEELLPNHCILGSDVYTVFQSNNSIDV